MASVPPLIVASSVAVPAETSGMPGMPGMPGTLTPGSSSAARNTGPPAIFTDNMRDRQARGKTPGMEKSAAAEAQHQRMFFHRMQQQTLLAQHMQQVQQMQHLQQIHQMQQGPTPAGPSGGPGPTGGPAGPPSGPSGGPAGPTIAYPVFPTPSIPENELYKGAVPASWPYLKLFMQNRAAAVHFDKQEDFEDTDPRRHAAVVLDTPELLMMYAQSTGDTIPATRLRFTRMMCGYNEETGEHMTGGRSSEDVLKNLREAAEAGKGKSRASGRKSAGKRKLPN